MDQGKSEVPPKVSIGMPVYNGEKYIREALDSLLAQTFTDFELIISDNASTDGTEVICREYAVKDSRIRYIRQPENRGPIANFQFVLDEAQGEYFMWAAHDDLCSPRTYLTDLVAGLLDGDDYSFPSVTIATIAKTNGFTSTELVTNVMEGFESCRSTFDFAKKSIENNAYQVYGLFRKGSLVEKMSYFHQCSGMRVFAEGLFVHAISSELQGRYVSTAVKIYRRHEGNISSTTPALRLFTDYIQFTAFVIIFWICDSRLGWGKKLYILAKISMRHTRYLIYLALASLKQVVFPLDKRSPR